VSEKIATALLGVAPFMTTTAESAVASAHIKGRAAAGSANAYLHALPRRKPPRTIQSPRPSIAVPDRPREKEPKSRARGLHAQADLQFSTSWIARRQKKWDNRSLRTRLNRANLYRAPGPPAYSRHSLLLDRGRDSWNHYDCY